MVFDVSANRRELVAKNGLSDRLRASFDSFRGATTREPTFECYEKETDKPEECWCAVKLTNNYIVAISSSRKDSHCYIFKIGDGTNLSARYKKPLLRKEFHALSVCQSPDTLACLLSDATNGSILWRAKIHWENPQPDTMATGSHSDGTSSSGNNEIRLELVEEKELPVERPDQQLEHFILDTHDTCYMVFPRRRDPLALSVVLNNFELQKSVTHRLLLKNHGHTMSRMFTDMTPFYKGSSISEAFMVTHSDQIWHFKSGRTCNDLTVDGYQPTDQYRLLSITTCEETGRIFALGGYSGCTSIELLEIGLDGTDVDPELTKRAKLNGLPENSEKLHLKVIHKSGTAAVLVMAVKPTKQYVIDL
ncbi:hypothetical protein NXS19_002203 [Fusarium pseudograminearum]|nr:hypothetical protein NXS19_002203 [Fusarium pseudograminearum]